MMVEDFIQKSKILCTNLKKSYDTFFTSISVSFDLNHIETENLYNRSGQRRNEKRKET